MTGYGVGRGDTRAARITVELRGVNQRLLDVRVTAPREYAMWEQEIRDRVRKLAHRGRVEVTVVRTPLAGRRRYRVAVCSELGRAYVAAVRRLARELRLDGRVAVADVLRLPELFEVVERPPEPARELPLLRRVLRGALRAFDADRRREGGHLRRDMRARARQLRRAAARMRRRLPRAEAALAARVRARLERLLPAAAEEGGRLAREIVTLVERGDITEELVRLDGHLAGLRAALDARGPVGRRVEFLLQEIHRELNTIGTKTGDRAISELVVAAKSEVEKVREQVQNVE
jgi:uncharacterized protein (TIGR00255 family)